MQLLLSDYRGFVGETGTVLSTFILTISIPYVHMESKDGVSSFRHLDYPHHSLLDLTQAPVVGGQSRI